MNTFFQWAEGEKLEMPVNPDHDPEQNWEDEQVASSVKSEQRARTGWSANYPAAYFSAQYPVLWMGPRKSTHALDAQHMGRKGK